MRCSRVAASSTGKGRRKSAMGWYFGYSLLNSPYGAAASLVVFMVWIYYSAQLFLFGAELTHVYVLNHGSRTEFHPSEESEPLSRRTGQNPRRRS
jgi:membrane protein